LVIKSQHGAGRTVDIDLSNKEHDFKYNGQLLEDDLLKEIRLTGDTTRVVLEIIDEQND